MVETKFCGGWSPRRPRASANDRQTGCGLHQGERSDDACLATQLRLRHGLLWNLTVSRRAELKLQNRLQLFVWQKHCCTVARACLRGCMCIFAVCTKQVPCAQVHAGVHILQVFLTSQYISATQTLQVVHMRSCVRILFICIQGRRGRGWTSLCTALIAWHRGLFLTEAQIEVWSCVFLFLTRVGMYVSVCVYTHAHTLSQTAHGVLDMKLGVRTRHLEGLKNPGRLNPGKYAFVYACKVCMCIYI